MKKKNLQSILNKLDVQNGLFAGGFSVLKGGRTLSLPDNSVCSNNVCTGGGNNIIECINHICEGSTNRRGCTDPGTNNTCLS